MKNFWISIRITLAMCLLLGVGYVLVLRGVSAVAGPGGGQAETLTFDGRTVGAANVGQQFTDTRYFWGRPSAVDYNGGSGLDPDISPRGAQVQVRRVAEARGLDAAAVRHLVDSLTQRPWLGLFGTEKVNVLRLNIALETMQPNVTAAVPAKSADNNGDDRSADAMTEQK